MSSFKKYLFFVFVVLVVSTEVRGQALHSPFSTYGIGESYGSGLIHNQGMGGIGVTNPQYWFINNQNPALLVYNNLTGFAAGLVSESRKVKSDSINEKNFAGNLNYLVTAFPIKYNKWTTSVGLMPFTRVDYKVQYRDIAYGQDGVAADTLFAQETGTGGLSQFYWANGVRVHKNISVGLRTSYIFGSTTTSYVNRTTNPRQVLPYEIRLSEKLQ
jgi:hypothetical protein